jgi:3-deoxy-manno-octulosonate cytidylyltransferase (CMP-KDO synthetase)
MDGPVMKLAIIIPARFKSTRFEGKPLVPICGRPMIQHVYERAKLADLVDIIIVATDDERIYETVRGFDGTAFLTSPYHETGTDRIVEVAKNIDCQWIINLQGDEPLIEPNVIDLLAREMFEFPQEKMFSLMRPVSEYTEFLNPNMVKVVTDHRDYALYFSRAPIPYPKGKFLQISDSAQTPDNNQICQKNAFIHCGIYGYSKDFLLSIPEMKPSILEKVEGLEQLRVLANGYRIKMVMTEYRSIGVDTPGDISIAEKLMKKKKACEPNL